MEDKRREELAALPPEELERRLREAFFYTDKIDESVFRELEALRQTLEAKRPREYDRTPEDSWAQFREDHAEELEEFCRREQRRKAAGRTLRLRTAVRGALLAAAILVLLAGAALAADSLGLWAWVPRWNATAGRYEPAVMEVSGKSPIPAALAELGITEPVYPHQIPEGFVITETRISEEPLILFEQYSRGNDRLSVTITPVKGFDSAFYQRAEEAAQTYLSGKAIHYMFRSAGTITAVWCTDHYVVSISGTISLSEINTIIDSVYAVQGKGEQL